MEEGMIRKADLEDVTKVIKKLKVEIKGDVVAKRLEKSFARLQKRAKIQGFRKGKAPLSMIKTRFKDEVVSRLEEELVQEGYMEAAKGRGVKAIAITGIEDGKYVEGEDFRFTATMEVIPDFEPKDYKGIEIPEIISEVTDEEIDSEIESIREMQAVYSPVSRKSGVNDLLEMSVKTFDGEEVIDEQENTTYVISGNSTLGEEFENYLTGKEAGEELDFTITYGDDVPIERLKGKDIRYMVEIKSVKEKELPEVNDEFASSLPEIENLEDLRGKIRERLASHKEQEGRKAQEIKIVDTLVANNPIEAPESLVDEEIRHMIIDTERRLREQGVQFDPSHINVESLRVKYRESALRSVKSSLILSEIAKKENITVEGEDLEEEKKRISETFQIPLENVASYYSEEKAKNSLSNTVLTRKVTDFLLKNAVTVAEKESSDDKEIEASTEKDHS